MEIVGISDLARCTQDTESDPPSSSVDFRNRVKPADAVFFATPEYNRSAPGVLKNAIDVGSRPYGRSVWSGKPAAVVSCSPGALGGFGANHHLHQSLVFLNMPTLQRPEAYFSGADEMFAPNREFMNASTKQFPLLFVTAFESWIRRRSTAIECA